MANKLLKSSLLLVLGVFALTGCDDIYAHEQLKDYKDPVVTGDGVDTNTYNNTMTSLYDDLHDGSLPSDVLTKTLYKYSISVFGKYNKLSEGTKVSDDITLKDAANIAYKVATHVALNEGSSWEATLSTVDPDGKFLKFVAAHPIAYESKVDGKDDIEMEIAKVLAKWNTIETRIAETMYDKINGGSYSFRSLFSEEKFMRSFIENMDDVNVSSYTCYPDQLIDPAFDKDEVFQHFLHRDNYQYNSGLDQDESANGNVDGVCYVEKNLIPTIYNNLLTEQYILEKSYASVGRSYARNVNIIEVSDNSDAPLAVDYMVNNYFVDLAGGERSFIREPNATTFENSTNTVAKQDFINLSDAVKGGEYNNPDLVAMKALPNSPIEETSMAGYFKGTEYGSVIEDYEDIYKDSSMYNTFSGNGKYSTKTGLELKNREVALNKHVKSGWFVKEDLSGYPFADELFNLQVSVALDAIYVSEEGEADVNGYDRWFKNELQEWELGGRERDYNKYVCRINGAYFLKNTKNDSKDPNRDIVFSSGGKYYVVQIMDAVSTSKVNEKSSSCYDALKLEEVKTEICKIIGTTGSYASSAKEYYLEKMNIKYHDQDVYDYFEANYPDLFDDED